jgi:Mg2+ and Co2+ transporter CorA
MNLILRPHADVNDVTWSIIWCLIILLIGVAYYIYTIMQLAFEELEDERSDK